MKTVKQLIRSLKNYLTAEQNEIVAAAGSLIVISIITKILGMLFLTLVTREFGASTETDMFYLASTLPETITNIILLGVISGSIIPIFIKIREKDGQEQFIHSFNSVMNVSMLVFAALSILAAIFSRQLMPLAISIAQKDQVLTDAQTNQVIWMMRALLIPQILLALSAFFSTWLNIYNRFVVPQLAPLFYNIGKIIGVLVFVRLLNGSIWGLVWGTLFGAALHLAVQIPLLKDLKYKFMPWLYDFRDKNLLKVLRLGLPRVLSLSMEQVATIVDSVIALSLTTGSLTAYQLAVRLISLPMGLFGTNFAIASFPSFAKLHANGEKQAFSELVFKTLNQIIFLSLPVAVIFIVMRVPIVRLVYGIFGGEFTWDNTLLVAWIVLFFSLGLTFEGLRSAMFRVYFAIHDSIIPMISSMFVVVGGIVTGIMFSNYFSHFNSFALDMLVFRTDYFFTKGNGVAGAAGLALSSSVIFTLEFVFLLFMLWKKKVVRNMKGFVFDLFKKLLAAAIMMLVCYMMAKLWDQVLNTTKTFQLIFLSISTMFSATLIYFWCSYLLKIPEGDQFISQGINGCKHLWANIKKLTHAEKNQ